MSDIGTKNETNCKNRSNKTKLNSFQIPYLEIQIMRFCEYDSSQQQQQ